MKKLYTIGTNGSTPTVFLSALLEHNITHLIDLRSHPNSGFARCNRSAIEKVLAKTNGSLAYSHIPKMPPSQKTKQAGMIADDYLRQMGSAKFNTLRDLLNNAAVPCLLSSEGIWRVKTSHRKILADHMVANYFPDCEVVHLDGRKVSAKALSGLHLYNGSTYNLKDVFHKVNAEYFNTRYNEQDIAFAWEHMLIPRGILGYYYYPAFIALNSILDHSRIPMTIIEAIMYHEMLHLQLSHDGLPSGHTVEFYLEDAKFKEYAQKFKFNYANALVEIQIQGGNS